MKLYFGKISAQHNAKQIEEGYYQAPKNSSWFGGIEPGDYAFVIGGNKIQLWQARDWSLTPQGEDRLDFDILFNTQLSIPQLVAFKYFKLDTSLIVKTTRSTGAEKRAFFPIETDAGFTETILLDISNYQKSSNFRNIVHVQAGQNINPKSWDLHFYFHDHKLELWPIKNASPELESKFRDNFEFLGKGQNRKDKTLSLLKTSEIGDSLGAKMSIKDFYDATMCPYNVKDFDTQYWVVNGYGKEQIDYCLKNNVFIMQFQYGQQKTPQVTTQLKNASRIKPGDRVLLFNQNHYYAHGVFTEHQVRSNREVTLSEQIETKIANNSGDIVSFPDAPCFYEDLSLDNGFNGEWGQRLEIDNWEDVHPNGIEIKGISNHVNWLRNTVMPLKNAEFFDQVEQILADQKPVLHKTENNPTQNMNTIPLNQILYGPPGTGKTYNTINKAIEIINPDFDLNQERKEIKKEFDRLVTLGQIEFVTFHQSMSYEDFVEGIKPQEPEETNGSISYKVEDGIFKEICTRAKQQLITSENFEIAYQKLLDTISEHKGKFLFSTLERSKNFTVYENSKGNLRFHANTDKAYPGVIRKEVIKHYLETGECKDWPSYVKTIGNYFVKRLNYKKETQNQTQNYVLIIDEINRGNVSAIFGELITLLEEDKRSGDTESITLTLPYSKEPFSVPANLYIIGTMNTADRSVEALDTALRRRFHFTEMMPDSSKIKQNDEDWEKLEGPENQKFSLSGLLNTINKRIEVLLDKDHTIGHSYFIKLNGIPGLQSAFKNKILPLLQEYFYGDYGKISLIVGKGFCDGKAVSEQPENRKLFAESNYDISGYDEKMLYEIGVPENEEDFIKAIHQLLNWKSD